MLILLSLLWRSSVLMQISSSPFTLTRESNFFWRRSISFFMFVIIFILLYYYYSWWSHRFVRRPKFTLQLFMCCENVSPLILILISLKMFCIFLKSALGRGVHDPSDLGSTGKGKAHHFRIRSQKLAPTNQHRRGSSKSSTTSFSDRTHIWAIQARADSSGQQVRRLSGYQISPSTLEILHINSFSPYIGWILGWTWSWADFPGIGPRLRCNYCCWAMAGIQDDPRFSERM